MRGLPATLARESRVPLGRTPAAVIAGTTLFRIARRAIFAIFLVILSNWRQYLAIPQATPDFATHRGRLTRQSARKPLLIAKSRRYTCSRYCVSESFRNCALAVSG